MKTGIHIFEKAISNLREKINPTTFQVWFSNVEFVSMNDNTVEISVPNKFFKEFFIHHYSKVLLEEIARITGSSSIPSIVITEREEKKEGIRTEKPAEPVKSSHPLLNPKYTFERFVVGKSNELAYYAARNVAEKPAQKYNPLVIYGKSGLGKTHLLNAIGHLWFARYKGNLLHISTEQFMNEFIYSAKNDDMPRFREKYRKNCELLLLDDIQFIGGKKEATQEELFNIVNHLLERKKQIVVVSNIHPSEIENLDEKFTSRILWGLTCEIRPPEPEVRKEILRFKSRLMGLSLSDEILEFVASNIKSNVRELESALNHIEAFSNLTKHKIDMDLVKESLKDFFRVEKNRITHELIIEIVSGFYNVDKESVLSEKKSRNIATARQVSIYLIRKYLNMSLSEISSVFGKSNHSVIIFSIKKVEKQIKSDEKFSQTIRNIEQSLTSI
ncbi:MAG: chromosomal replication initiator protein DnaA [Deltaproteobacteria bacterium]|nr:chromosomal replication initiator protein DnaA [Deltaproteobacteria bacterium]